MEQDYITDEEQLAKKDPTKVFNKGLALRNSTQFTNLRESITRTSEARPESRSMRRGDDEELKTTRVFNFDQ